MRIISCEQSQLNSFFAFLQEGVLPWSSTDKQEIFRVKNIEKFSEQKAFKELFIQKMLDKTVEKRLIYQFDDQSITIMLKKVAKTHIHQDLLSPEIIRTVVAKQDRNLFWQVVIRYILFDESHTCSSVN